MRDSVTGRSRGFGFVTFAEAASSEKVLNTVPLELDGRSMDAKPAVPKDQMPSGPRDAPQQAASTKKLFVGGLSPETAQTDLQDYFAQFGTVSEAVIMMDNNTGRPRGFGFVTFELETDADKVMASSQHIISNKQVECKRATPRTQGGGRGGGRGGYGGRGGGRGYGGPPGPYGGPGYGGYGGYGGGYGYGGYGYGAPQQGYGPPPEEYGRGGYQGGYGGPSTGSEYSSPSNSYGAYSRNTRNDRSYHPYSR